MSAACQPCTEIQILEAIARDLSQAIVGPTATSQKSVVFKTGSFTRPADTNNYEANDMLMDATSGATLNEILEAALFAGRGGVLQSAVLWKSGTGTTGAAFEVQFFSSAAAQVPAQDNAPENVLVGNAPFYLGSINFPSMTTGAGGSNTGARAEVGQIALPYVCLTDTTLRWAVKCIGAYTDEASEEVFTLGLGLLRD